MNTRRLWLFLGLFEGSILHTLRLQPKSLVFVREISLILAELLENPLR